MTSGKGTIWRRPESGTWSYRVDLPPVDGKRREARKHGFGTKREATAARDAVLKRRDMRVTENGKITTGEYLAGWIAEQRHERKPSTWFNYERYTRMDLIPALGTVALQELHHDHVRQFVADLVAAGRGPTTVRRIVAVLSSALSDAVE